MARNYRSQYKAQPIVLWSKCAVWDFLTLVAPSYGFSNQGLVEHYGPDGDLRYGCWSCPLVFNDRTAEYLAKENPILYELIRWTGAHLRRGGSAWQKENREWFQGADGRLSLRYCRRMFDELMDMSKRYGVQLLEPYQVYGIKSAWAWRESLPESQAGFDMVIPLPFDEVEAPASPPLHISKVQHPVANILAHAPLFDDDHHRMIQIAAKILVAGFGMKTWVYQSSSSNESVWRAGDLIVSVNPDTFTVRFPGNFAINEDL